MGDPGPGAGRTDGRVIDLKVFASRTHQCFGHWAGRVRDDTGEWVRVAEVVGWAEDVHNRW